MDVLRSGRVGVILGFVGLIAVVGSVAAWVALGSKPSLDLARREYDQGDWKASAATTSALLQQSPDDGPTLRLQARSLAKLGRSAEALSRFARLGGDRLEAEDLFLIGRSLQDDDRPTLGWGALDAASKLDPKHRATADLLAGRSSRKDDQASRSDRLSAISSGPALAEVVVGLATLEPRGDRSPLLDRLLRRDRATLAKIRTPAEARKLLARLLLEEGRAVDARERLEGGDDPESHWLLSRAYLAEGQFAKAEAEARRAGTFGQDQPMAFEPSTYLGAGRCASCHREIHDSQQTSHHASTLASGDGLRSVPLPPGPVVDPENPAVVHRFDRDGSKLQVSTRVGEETLRAVIDYALGSGHHGVTMLARESSGRHRSLRLSYYAGGNHWGLTSGFEPRPADPHGYIGEVLNDSSFRNCLNCHSTRFESEGDRRGPEAADHGIGCERCHGPGDNHVRAVEADFPDVAIARPKLATPGQRLKLCAQCHASDGVIPPADPRFIRFQATTLPYSRCVSESGGKLDCVACHDPHRNVETNPVHYDTRCLACHAGNDRKPEPGVRVESVPASRCPVNPSAKCTSCHMPKVDNVMPFMSFTDHHIRVHRPSSPAGSPGSPP